LAFPNPGRGLKTGTSCNVRVRNGGTGAQLLAPYQAVTEQLGEYFVYVVAGGKAHLRKITPGPTLGDQVVVLAGLQPGERIVVDGLQKLRDGAPVQTGNVPAQTARLPR
jgi:membrane fusion protein (multidrug efflux system)